MLGRQGALESILGGILFVAGLGLLAEVGFYMYRHGRLEEPASHGRTPNPSARSDYSVPLEKASDAELDRMIRRELDEMREEGRRDVLVARIHLYAIAPAGVLLAVVGVWLLTARPRKQSESGG